MSKVNKTIDEEFELEHIKILKKVIRTMIREGYPPDTVKKYIRHELVDEVLLADGKKDEK